MSWIPEGNFFKFGTSNLFWRSKDKVSLTTLMSGTVRRNFSILLLKISFIKHFILKVFCLHTNLFICRVYSRGDRHTDATGGSSHLTWDVQDLYHGRGTPNLQEYCFGTMECTLEKLSSIGSKHCLSSQASTLNPVLILENYCSKTVFTVAGLQYSHPV